MIILELALLIFFCWAYQEGGQSHKWIRRYLGGIGFGLGLMGLALLSGKFGLCVALGGVWYCPSMVLLKYGVNDGSEFDKAVLRAIYGASLGFAGFLISISAGHIYIGFFQLLSAAWSSYYFGTKNPFSNDPRIRELIAQNPKFQDLPVRLEDICIISGCVGFIPFLF